MDDRKFIIIPNENGDRLMLASKSWLGSDLDGDPTLRLPIESRQELAKKHAPIDSDWTYHNAPKIIGEFDNYDEAIEALEKITDEKKKRKTNKHSKESQKREKETSSQGKTSRSRKNDKKNEPDPKKNAEKKPYIAPKFIFHVENLQKVGEADYTNELSQKRTLDLYAQSGSVGKMNTEPFSIMDNHASFSKQADAPEDSSSKAHTSSQNANNKSDPIRMDMPFPKNIETTEKQPTQTTTSEKSSIGVKDYDFEQQQSQNNTFLIENIDDEKNQPRSNNWYPKQPLGKENEEDDEDKEDEEDDADNAENAEDADDENDKDSEDEVEEETVDMELINRKINIINRNTTAIKNNMFKYVSLMQDEVKKIQTNSAGGLHVDQLIPTQSVRELKFFSAYTLLNDVMYAELENHMIAEFKKHLDALRKTKKRSKLTNTMMSRFIIKRLIAREILPTLNVSGTNWDGNSTKLAFPKKAINLTKKILMKLREVTDYDDDEDLDEIIKKLITRLPNDYNMEPKRKRQRAETELESGDDNNSINDDDQDAPARKKRVSSSNKANSQKTKKPKPTTNSSSKSKKPQPQKENIVKRKAEDKQHKKTKRTKLTNRDIKGKSTTPAKTEKPARPAKVVKKSKIQPSTTAKAEKPARPAKVVKKPLTQPTINIEKPVPVMNKSSTQPSTNIEKSAYVRKKRTAEETFSDEDSMDTEQEEEDFGRILKNMKKESDADLSPPYFSQEEEGFVEEGFDEY